MYASGELDEVSITIRVKKLTGAGLARAREIDRLTSRYIISTKRNSRGGAPTGKLGTRWSGGDRAYCAVLQRVC